MEKESYTYYYEWLYLKKEEFMILDLLAESNKFVGNLSDLIRKFHLAPTNRLRRKFKNAIDGLKSIDYLRVDKSGRTYTLELASTENLTSITVECKWINLKRLRIGKFSENVHWVNVLKTFLYLNFTKNNIFTNQEIADHLNISTTTVNLAKKVLTKDFNTLRIDYQYRPKKNPKDEPRCMGQKADFNAFPNIPEIHKKEQKSFKYKNIIYLK